MQQNPILILDTFGGASRLRIEYMSSESIDHEINGEAASHIYNVRMLTEYILRELSESDTAIGVSFSEDDISDIATASALHDIGKLQIPKGILNSTTALSPVEYDMVKKHSVLGEQSIRDAWSDDISSKVVEYAAQIARSHHERINGMGYPDGLRGQEIPLYVQVVSIADSYDALTGVRSYKSAISQDVALQMIKNGHCGAFDEELVNCLGRAVKLQNLAFLRKSLEKKRSVVNNDDSLQLNRVLLVGNTEYLDKDFTDRTFPQSNITIISSNGTVITDRKKSFHARKFSVKMILETYEFDLIVFLAEGLSFHSDKKSDSTELREVLKYSAALQKNARILYLSPLDAIFQSNIDRAIITSANEKLCEFYSSKYSLDIKIIRIPYLYSWTYKKDFLHNIFEQIYTRKTVLIPESRQSKMHFLSTDDLSDLISRSIDDWKTGGGILSCGDEFHLTFSDLAKKITELDENAKIDFTDSDCSGELTLNNTDLRSQYGWYAKISLIDDFKEQYERFLATKQNKTLIARISAWISEHTMLVKTLELFLLFALSELLVHQTGSAVIFSAVDFRTVFIVIMATMYGSFFGTAAASLSGIAYFISRIATGTNPLTMFYETTNWLTFAIYFLVGGLCGYVHRKNRDNLKIIKEENELLRDKFSFISELYNDTLYDKRELKKQIYSSKDNFGKLLDIVQKLNTVAPRHLYLKIVETFEEVLENKSIAVYSINPNTTYGRLQVASRDMAKIAARSINIESFAPVIDQFKDGGIWKNTDLNIDYPMYAAGIYRDDDLLLMIFLWHADTDQRTLYYMNLIRIMCDLARMSFMRAYDYTLATLEKQYIPNTHIMNAQYFEECVKNYISFRESKRSSFILLGIDSNGHTLEEVDKMLTGKIRATDILGITSDGQLQLILPQATPNDLQFILPRYEGIDITVTLMK